MRDLDDTVLERRLREVLEEHLGALPLDLTVDDLDRRREARGRARRLGRGRGITLLAAAAAVLLVGGALVVGSGVLRRPAVVPPVPAPSLAALVAPSPDTTTPSASDLARPSASPIPVAGPGGEWIRTGSMITSHGYADAVRLRDGRVLVAGGDPSGVQAELYDPTTGTWSATGSTIHNLSSPMTLLPDGRVLGGLPDSAELYDPAIGTWTATGTTPNDGAYLASSALLRNGKVLVVFNAPGWQGRAVLYDPASGTWTATSKSAATLYDSTLVSLSDGRVLAAGGAAGCDRCSIKSAELYDPQTDSWVGTADMPWPGQHMQATQLQDGTVLFDIHSRILGAPGGGVALYDPSTVTWTAVENAPNGTKFARLTRLLDGRVLMTGWDGGAAEVYDPATRSWAKAASMLPSSSGDFFIGSTTLLADGTVLVTGQSSTGEFGAQRYIPAGVSPPTGLVPLPDPTPTPTPTASPTPGPTPLPPTAGPVPQGARPFEVTVENKSSKSTPLFLAREPLNDMGQLCGSVTPDVVPAHTTEKVTFQLPPKSVNDCWLMIRPGPGADGTLGPTNEWPTPGHLLFQDGGDNANGDDLSTYWAGP